MFSSMDDRLFFHCTQDNVTLLRARELDTRTRGFTLYRQVLQTICTHSERRSNPDDTLEWLCLSCNYLRLTKATFWPPTLARYLLSSIYLSGEANKRAVNISLPPSPHAVNQANNYSLCCVRERGAELIQSTQQTSPTWGEWLKIQSQTTREELEMA